MENVRWAPRDEEGEGDGGREEAEGAGPPGLVFCSERTKSYWCSIQECTRALRVLDESERSWVRRAM